jgi:Domain of unknown function (DUF4124)
MLNEAAVLRGSVGFLRQQSLNQRTDVGEFAIFTMARATAFLALILIPSLSSAAIYKCTGQDGSITYTDAPCPAETTTQSIDPAQPSWLNQSLPDMTTTAALPDAKSQSQPEVIAALCANDEFKFWLKAQRHGLPERDARTAKFIHISYLCRRALHLPDVAAPIPPMPREI